MEQQPQQKEEVVVLCGSDCCRQLYPNNKANHFKVHLETPIRGIDGHNWEMALTELTLPGYKTEAYNIKENECWFTLTCQNIWGQNKFKYKDKFSYNVIKTIPAGIYDKQKFMRTFRELVIESVYQNKKDTDTVILANTIGNNGYINIIPETGDEDDTFPTHRSLFISTPSREPVTIALRGYKTEMTLSYILANILGFDTTELDKASGELKDRYITLTTKVDEEIKKGNTKLKPHFMSVVGKEYKEIKSQRRQHANRKKANINNCNAKDFRLLTKLMTRSDPMTGADRKVIKDMVMESEACDRILKNEQHMVDELDQQLKEIRNNKQVSGSEAAGLWKLVIWKNIPLSGAGGAPANVYNWFTQWVAGRMVDPVNPPIFQKTRKPVWVNVYCNLVEPYHVMGQKKPLLKQICEDFCDKIRLKNHSQAVFLPMTSSIKDVFDIEVWIENEEGKPIDFVENRETHISLQLRRKWF